MDIIVPLVIIIIIGFQIYFFVGNLRRMWQFENIFSNEDTWDLQRHPVNRLVNGLSGEGNEIFKSILESINKYLGNNAGSVIDFSLLKDAVDRHCDTVENDIATQTPIPLYFGLAGTMAGVILGLWDLLASDAILTLMGSSANLVDSAAGGAANGINSLLWGVAWAMGASIVGILLTTINSILFKRCKLKEDSGKSTFLAWMQSELLPELPSDISQALSNMVKNLNRFNSTFANNTSNLAGALKTVNQSYAIQADIIKAVHDMDVMKMAKANVRVLEELQNSTEKLEVFNGYLDDIKGYTDAIHRFEKQFQEEADRIHVLEEIRDFFKNYKGSITKTTADADKTLKDSLASIRETTSSNVSELEKRLVDLSNSFKQIIQDEKETFEKMSAEIRTQFGAQLSNMPQIAKRLDEISTIPSHLNKLLDKIESSNAKLVAEVARSIKQNTPQVVLERGGANIPQSTMPNWMKISGWAAIVVIAAACVFNIVVMFFPLTKKVQSGNTQENVTPASEQTQTPALANDSIASDTIKVSQSASNPLRPFQPSPTASPK